MSPAMKSLMSTVRPLKERLVSGVTHKRYAEFKNSAKADPAGVFHQP
jgi:hypothetical protein